MADQGMKIVKSGFPITETNPKNMVFTSAKGVLGTREVVVVNTTTNASGIVNTFDTHGLGYVPIVEVWVINKFGIRMVVPNQWQTNFGDYIVEENFYYYVDNNKVYLKVYAYQYEPIQGGDMFELNGQAYVFEIIYYFNELNDEE